MSSVLLFVRAGVRLRRPSWLISLVIRGRSLAANERMRMQNREPNDQPTGCSHWIPSVEAVCLFCPFLSAIPAAGMSKRSLSVCSWAINASAATRTPESPFSMRPVARERESERSSPSLASNRTESKWSVWVLWAAQRGGRMSYLSSNRSPTLETRLPLLSPDRSAPWLQMWNYHYYYFYHAPHSIIYNHSSSFQVRGCVHDDNHACRFVSSCAANTTKERIHLSRDHPLT